MSFTRKCLLLLAALIAGGCSQSTAPLNLAAQQQPHPALAQDTLAQLPAVPAGRAAAVIMNSDLDGAAAYDQSLNASVADTALELSSSSANPAWAIYELNGGLEFLLEVDVLLTVDAPGQVYLGVADYAAGTWQFGPAVTESETLSFDQEHNRSPDGNYYLVVLTSGGDSATVNGLHATLDNGWTVVVVDTGLAPLTVSRGGELMVVDGNPAIAYFDNVTQHLKYASSTDPLGLDAESWSIEVIDADGDVGRWPSMALVDGQPAISYTDYSLHNLKYARRIEAGGGWDIDTVDDAEYVGNYSSLAVIAGNPAISYQDGTNHSLKYCRATTPSGFGPGNFWTIATAKSATSGAFGWFTSMIEIDGRPAIAHQYRDTDLGELYYSICDNELGLSSGQWTHVRVDHTSAITGTEPELFLLDGLPGISYLDETHHALRAIVSSTADGADSGDWSLPIQLDPGTDGGGNSSYALIDGRPALAYQKRAYGDGRFAWADSASLGGSWQYMNVDEEGYTGDDSSLAVIDGHPAVSYFNTDDGELRYAIYQPL